MKSVMVHQFSQVPRADIPRSSFNRSHGLKTAFDTGYLVPIFVDEALPGDTFNLRHTLMARMQTPVVPFMDNLFLDTFYFAVPIRLIWTNFKKMMGERDNPADSVDYTVPVMTSTAVTGYANESLHDYLTIPTGIPDLEHSSLFHRAYNLIWNTWFRDQNLQDSVVVDVDDGPDSPADYVLLKRGKRHDYFTSCLPSPQKGDAVDLPLGTSAPINWPGTQGSGHNVGVYSDGDAGNRALYDGTGSSANLITVTGTDANTRMLYADLSSATSATINQLRQAFQVQRLYERDMRGGTRYIEQIKAHFGVTSPDQRQQRPEYLGGGSSPITVTPVPQTSSTDVTTPQGNLAGFITAGQQNGFTKSFTEHCVLIGLANVRADLTYQQGLNRMFSRSSRLDFYWPALAMIGEQAVLNKEIYAQGSLAATDDNVFGYQERYAEYRYKPSVITGKMRSNDANTLDVWHLSQEFGALPVLNSSFIQEAPPVDRVLTIPTGEPEVFLDGYFNLQCARPMPLFGVPGMIDHF